MNPRCTSGCGLLVFVLASATASAQPTTRLVDCDAGERIQTAIDAARTGDTILVRGVCVESIRINDEVARLTLDGQGLATIRGTNPTANAVLLAGRNITVRRFTIVGGRNGIALLRGGTALIEKNTIQESGDNGVNVAQHSYARIVGNTIRLHPSAGIRVIESSFARIGFLDLDNSAPAGNVITGNGEAGGVLIQRSAGASLVGNTLSENRGPGVSVDAGSHGDLAGNLIDDNGSDGVAVSHNSFVQLGDGPGILSAANDTNVPNAGAGLSCSANSSADGQIGTLVGAGGARKFDSSCANGPKIK